MDNFCRVPPTTSATGVSPPERVNDFETVCVRSHFGDTKTEASRKPVPLHPAVASTLGDWRKESDFAADHDFVFPSIRLNGRKPLSPDMVLKKIIRPALIRAGVHGKVIGWHSFRHSLATNLRAAGVDLKTAQELLRHANSRMTLEVYTRSISETKREANDLVVQMMLEGGNRRLSALSPAPSTCIRDCHYSTKSLILFDLVAGTTGLEPATSAVTGQRSNQLSYVPTGCGPLGAEAVSKYWLRRTNPELSPAGHILRSNQTRRLTKCSSGRRTNRQGCHHPACMSVSKIPATDSRHADFPAPKTGRASKLTRGTKPASDLSRGRSTVSVSRPLRRPLPASYGCRAAPDACALHFR